MQTSVFFESIPLAVATSVLTARVPLPPSNRLVLRFLRDYIQNDGEFLFEVLHEK